MRSERARWLVLAAVLSGCSFEWDALRPRADGGSRADVQASADADVGMATTDAGTPDTGESDVGETDAGTDAGTDASTDVGTDVGVMDAGRPDVGTPDTGPRDVGTPDVGTPDVGTPDVGTPDVGTPDAGPTCTGMACACSTGAPTGWCAIGSTCVSGACMAGTVAGSLVITEIMNDTDVVGDAVGEWFEIYNTAETPVDLRGLRVRGNGAEMFDVTSTTPVLIAGRGYAVLGINPDTTVNGGVTMTYAYGAAMNLSNTSDVITLLSGTVTIDAVAYPASGWPETMGRSKSLRPTVLDASLNDVATAWCSAGPTFGRGDHGTPGAANVCQ